MEPHDRPSQHDTDDAPIPVAVPDDPAEAPETARDALRATPNQHSFDDLDDDDATDSDGARTYHGADDPA